MPRSTRATATSTSESAAVEPEAPPPVHYDALPLGSSGHTPTALNPAWLVLLAFVLPAATWIVLAWKRALDEDPTRLRRSGVRELRKLLAKMARNLAPPEKESDEVEAASHSSVA